MGTLKDKEAVARFNKKQKELNSLPAIDYEAVNQTKWEYYRLLFRQDGEKTLSSKGFKEFFDANKEWLQPYAVFSYLRDAYKTPNFREWPKYSTYHAKEIEKMCQPETADYPHIALYFLYSVSSAFAVIGRYPICSRARCRTERRYPYRYQPE